MDKVKRDKAARMKRLQVPPDDDAATRPDWTRKCVNCGSSPIVPLTGMCGPCTFGESETNGGNW